MRIRITVASAVFVLASLVYGGPNTITYQGSVINGAGTPVADGNYMMRFSIWNTLSGGTLAAWQETDANVAVNGGLFSTTLGDGMTFGALFANNVNLWLEVEIDLNHSGTFESNERYAPRQKMSAAAWAIDADTLDGKHAAQLGDIMGVTAGTGLLGGGTSGTVTLSANPNYLQRRVTGSAPVGQYIRTINADGTVVTGVDQVGIGDITAVTAGTGLSGGGASGAVTLSANTNYLQRRVAGSAPAGQYIRTINADGTVVTGVDQVGTGDITTVNAGTGLSGGGTSGSVSLAVLFGGTGVSTSVAHSDHAHAGGIDWSLWGNATTSGTHFLGTTNFAPLDVRVDGRRALRIEPTLDFWNTPPNIIFGHSENSITSGLMGATISGGGDESGSANSISGSGYYGTVGGGIQNTVVGYAATIAGGRSNAARNESASIGGGRSNQANGIRSTVAGGNSNTASGTGATIGGGNWSVASGDGSFVGGGNTNIASGLYATVSGGAVNDATSNSATVGGGFDNTASGEYVTVAGGYRNVAGGAYATIGGGRTHYAPAQYATISGGYDNGATGEYATVAGGYDNGAGNQYATVSGGGHNSASGQYATVAGGGYSSATADYAFVGGGYRNTASFRYAVVGGGELNAAAAQNATVGGGFFNRAAAIYATVGGGYQNWSRAEYATVGGGYLNLASQLSATVGGGSQNTAGGPGSTVAGGTDNTAQGSAAFVGGGLNNTATTQSATIAGGKSNFVGNAYGTIAGGEDNGIGGMHATIGGGWGNQATGGGATVGGGFFNVAQGQQSTVAGGGGNYADQDYATIGGGTGNWAHALYATVGGGQNNQAISQRATVAGGENNLANGDHAFIGGGSTNLASGGFATIPGGYLNEATANYTFAAGQQAKALHVGTFVWNDSSPASFASTANDQFLVRATGGVGINTNVPGGFGLRVGGMVGFDGQLDMAADGSTARIVGVANPINPQDAANKLYVDNAVLGSVGNADTLDGQHGSFYQDATNIVAGALGDAYFSAYSDLGAEGYLGNAAGDLAQNNGTLQTTLNADLLDGMHATSLWNIGGNAGLTSGTHFVGTTDNMALDLRTNNARALRLEPGTFSPNLIGGSSGNSIQAGVSGATIAGGGTAVGFNRVTDSYGTVGGGAMNRVGDGDGNVSNAMYGTVAGGYQNKASDDYAIVAGGILNIAGALYATVGGGRENEASTGSYTTVGGGYRNTASGTAATIAGGNDNVSSGPYAAMGGGQNNDAWAGYSTVGGGQANRASGFNSTVGGGAANFATGPGATIPGGSSNVAAGANSFAAGQRAKANHHGCFVWNDTTASDLSSTVNDQFMVRATGGAIFYTNPGWVSIRNDGTNLIVTSAVNARLTLAGIWTNGSDRNQKENFVPVDGREVLDKLATVPINTWNSKVENSSIRHMGPTAQDLYAAFGLGDSDKTIGTIDADGVALAAIQGLYQMLQEKVAEMATLKTEKDAQIAELKAEKAAQEQRLADLEKRLLALETRLPTGQHEK